jgi:hypothetical protein
MLSFRTVQANKQAVILKTHTLILSLAVSSQSDSIRASTIDPEYSVFRWSLKLTERESPTGETSPSVSFLITQHFLLPSKHSTPRPNT